MQKNQTSTLGKTNAAKAASKLSQLTALLARKRCSLDGAAATLYPHLDTPDGTLNRNSGKTPLPAGANNNAIPVQVSFNAR
jgi:hypothetical protein